MKTRTTTLRILSVVLAAGVLFAACQKSDRTATRSYPAAVQNQIIAATNDYYAFDEQESEEFDMIMGYGDYADGTTTEIRPGCYTITYVPAHNVLPHQKIIDFGDGCYTPNGKLFKKGKIIITQYDPAETGGKKATLEYSKYYVNGWRWTGGECIYLSTNSHGEPVRRVVEDKKRFYPNDWDYNCFIGERSYTQTAGVGTNSRSDDEYDIRGIALGSQFLDGELSPLYESNVALHNPIKQVNSCRVGKKVSGAVNIRLLHVFPLDIINEVLDYGDGSCDAKRTLYVEGVPTAVDFPIQAWPY